MRRAALLALSILLIPFGVRAQPLQETIRGMASQAPDLSFPAEGKEMTLFSALGMAIYKPAGDGPFPALVIVHSCGGLRAEIKDWAKEAVSRGYVAFVLDSLTQRGVKQVCMPPTPVNVPRGAKDAFQALEHLQQFAFVDPRRIGLIGFSWGGMVGLLASSKAYAEALSPERRFAAVVSFYPICYLAPRGNRGAIEFLRPDHDRPALVLLAEEDTEAPPSDCLARLKTLKENGVPVDWHLYAGATHCWDCSSLHNFSKVDFLGNRVVYRHDKQVTTDSIRRTFEYFDARLKAH